MKRILALAAVAGALVLGGCGRPHTTQPADGPPAATARAAKSGPPAARPAASPASAASAASSSAGDVDSLLGDVDKQLNSDDQTPADQD